MNIPSNWLSGHAHDLPSPGEVEQFVQEQAPGAPASLLAEYRGQIDSLMRHQTAAPFSVARRQLVEPAARSATAILHSIDSYTGRTTRAVARNPSAPPPRAAAAAPAFDGDAARAEIFDALQNQSLERAASVARAFMAEREAQGAPVSYSAALQYAFGSEMVAAPDPTTPQAIAHRARVYQHVQAKAGVEIDAVEAVRHVLSVAA